MKKLLTLLLIIYPLAASPQDYFRIENNTIVLDNGKIVRRISADGSLFISTAMFLEESRNSFISKSREFSFTANGILLDGNSGWKMIIATPLAGENEGRGISAALQCNKFPGLKLKLNYLLYPGMPVIRKWISFENSGSEDIRIEDLSIEDIETTIDYVHSVVYGNYGRMKHLGTFTGTWDDPVIVLHEFGGRRGIAVGNESPGVLKRTSYHTKRNNIEAGLTLTGQGIAFRKWLRAGEKWESPKIFICLYSGTDNGSDVLNGDVNRFVIRHMNTRIVSAAKKPVFVYNTWNPFRTFVSDSLVRDVAKAAAECGVQEFIIDDGWQVNEKAVTSDQAWGKNYGDWLVDEKKFPGGLRPTFDYIRSLGMKPGLWISIGSATPDAKVFREHPEWFVKAADGSWGNIHQGSSNKNFVTSCMGTEWTGYIRDKILSLVNDHGLAYAKLDFAVVASAYVNDDSITGCYATGHPFHKDHRESFIVIYERLLKLFDELHAAAPELFIDCTFETAGRLQLMDYAIAQHAEGNWLSNVEQPFPTGALRVRQLAWWRSPGLPASSLVIGNLQMDGENFEFGLKSLIGSLPIVLGDPRKIPTGERAIIKKWSVWMQEMQNRYDYMSYRKDLRGFGQPDEGMWDGWSRINFDTKAGGIIGVFRQNASETKRTVVLTDLDPGKRYSVRMAPDGREVLQATGKSLMEKGFEVSLQKEYDGNIYEIALLKN